MPQAAFGAKRKSAACFAKKGQFVTTEDDFQAALNAHPDDHHTRLVFADWLDERNDPRAAGYRALGRLQLWPFRMDVRSWWSARGGSVPIHNHLPRDWFEAVAGHKYSSDRWRWPDRFDNQDNRREIEDAAALAFATLPAARQAELLTSQPKAKPPKPQKPTPKKKGKSRKPATKKAAPTRKSAPNKDKPKK